MLRPINTISDLLNLARQNNGVVHRETLVKSGLGSVGAVAAELRRRGYEVHVPANAMQVKIVAAPHVGAQRRFKDQERLFDMPPTRARPRGFGDSDCEG